MIKKVCSKCKEDKDFCEFQKNSHSKDGYRSECSLCSKKNKELILKEKIKEYSKKFREKNRINLSQKQKIYYYNNIDKENIRSKKFREKNKSNNPHNCLKTEKEIRDKRLEWIKNNREINKEKRKIKYNNNILYRLSQNVRSRLNNYLKKNNITKQNKTFDIVGCSPNSLKEFIQKQFVDGMSWENRNEWHLDHIIPLCSAKTEEELYNLCHYTNLQPLWVKDNLTKGSKIML
jgi:hypothetical protein